MNKEIILKISGLVQGVFFRAEAKKIADQLGIRGYVKNDPEGKVIIVAQGDDQALKKLEKWCWQGSAQAKVEDVKIKKRSTNLIYKKFKIKR